MKEFGRLSLALAVTCLAAGLILAVVNEITSKPIAVQNKRAELKAVAETLPPYDNDPVTDRKILTIDGQQQVFYIGKRQGEIVGVAFETFGIGYSGKIMVMVGISPDGKITGIQIRAHQETPGLGSKIEGKSFLDQFKGLSLLHGKGLVNGKLAVNKDGGTIDAITGATISSRGVTQAVNKALELFDKEKSKLIGN